MPETGVKGLLKFIVHNPDTREKTSVCQLQEKVWTKTNKKPLLLCDYYSVIAWILSRADRLAIQRKRLSPYSLLFGGNFKRYSRVIMKLVKSLQRLGVQPVFFIDSPPGSNEDEMRATFYELKERHLDQLEQNHVIQQVCDGKRDILQVPWRLREAISVEVEMLLRAMAVPLFFCNGDADHSIVHYSRLHEEVCGVLSTDTVFATIPSIQLLHLDFFDPDNRLIVSAEDSLADPVVGPDYWPTFSDEVGDPLDIVCEVTSAERLASVLGIGASQLIDLSILCGNSYTRELNRYMSTWALLGLADLTVETVAEWLSQETVPLPSNAVIKSICTQVPAYRDAITHSYKVCQGADATSLGHRQGHFRPEGGSGAGRGCSAVTGFAHWRPVTVEATTLGHPCIGDLTLPIRKVWYTLLGLKRVTEYGRVGNKTFAELVVVLGQACPGNLGPLHFVQAMTLRDRVSCLFFLLTSGHHLLEKGESLPTVLSHSVVMGRTLKDPISCQGVLVCTCLLLMAELNSKGQPSPAIRISELEALIVVCLLCCAGVPPCHTTVLPNMRAITIASWFTSILEHAYYTALLLCLCCELPGPSHCFYGLAYVPFHIATVNQNHSEFLTADLGPNVLEARRIFDHVINLPSVLGLRSFILNKSHQCELQHVLDIFAVAVREVSENSAVLTPSEGLDMAIPLEMGYEFDGGALHLSPGEVGEMSEEHAVDSSLARDQNSSSESYYFETLGGLHDSEILSDEEEEGTNTLSAEVPLEASRQEYSVQAEKDEADASVCASPFAKKRSPVRLPVVDHRENIMELIHKHRVVCIQGETGCGKSTKVPQFILDDALSSTSPKACKILVSQPRRVAAMKLAERVAAERHEALGKTVGFAVAGEKRRGSDTAIVYCTTGYLLQMLVHDPFKIEQYTHIVLDEIHERNIDADFAMLVVRKLVSDMPHVKVVLMSATMQVDLVVRYFQEVFGKQEVSAPYFVGMKLFPVETFFVDDLGGLAERRKNFWHISQGKAASLLKVLATVVLEANKQTLLLRCKPEVTSYMKNLCTEIIISQATLGESILVFLPGMADIITYFESLSEELRDRELSEHFSLFMLHSQIPLQEQRAAFAVPPADRVHLILATNIAESSVTLPRLSLVINFGIYRQLEYNSKRHITCLSHRWCSHASCSQRAGRVGRVCAGTAIHLVTRQFYDAVFPEYDLAAMATAPLSKLVLQAKQIGVKVGVPSVTQLLSLAVEPPSLQQLEAALQDLAHMGAIASLPGTEISEEAPITLLGYVSLSLPVELPLARLVFFGVLFGCACDAVVLAASLSLDQDVFTLPSRLVMEEKKYRASLVRSMKWREYYDGSTYSEPIAVYRMFRDFLQFKMDAGSKRGRSRCAHARLFSQNVAVRYDRLLQLESVVGDISSRMLGHLEKDTAAYGELSKLASVAFSRTGGDDVNVMPTFCDDPDMLKFLLVASFCHQSVFGVTECNSCFKKQRAHAVNLLNTVKELGLDYMRTLAFKNLRNVTQLDLDTVARHILPQHHCQTLIANKTGFIQVSEGFDSNAKDELTCSVTTDLQYEDLDGVGDVRCDRGRNSFCGSDVVSSPIPSELRLLWQYGERRVAWKARPDAAELTRPAHPCGVSWYRMNVEKEMVIPGSWRNIAGFVCELEPCETPFFAVPFMLQGTCNGPTMVARGFTVLPSLKHSARVLRMLVGFQPLSTGVDLFVDRAGRKVIGARINSCLVMFEHHKLTPADMLKINVLRMLISSVVSTVSSDEAIIPCNKATSISWVMQDLLNGVFDHCSVLQELSLTENVEPLEETLEPAWEVASSKPSDTAGIPVALVERCPSLKSFELYPTLACSLVQQNVLKEACSLLLQSVGSGLDETPRGSSEPAVAHIQDPGVSFRLSPTAPPFTPIFASGNVAVHCAAPLHSVPAVASPTPSSSIQNLPALSHSNIERIPASPASKLAIGSLPLSHFSFPPASPHFHHSPPPRPVTSHTSPLHTDPVPFPSRSHPFQVPLTTPTSPLLPCPAVGSEVDRATLQRALELHILHNYWSSQQQPRQPTPASPSLLKGNSPTSLTTSPVPNSHLEEVQAAMRLMAAVPVFASISRLPPMSPLSNRSPLSARSQVLNPSSVSPSETMPIHPPQMTSLPQGLFFDPQVSKLKMQQRLRVGQPVGDVSTGSAQQRQDLEPPDASPHFVPASPVWSGYQRSVQEVSTDSGPSVTSGDPYQTSMPSISPSTSPSSGKPKAQLEEQRLVEFMVDYIACRGNCVNFSQLCRDAYPSYKQKYSIMGDEMALTWHFFVRHPKIFALFGHPGYCLVQLLVKSSFEAPLGNKESPETGIINCSSRETDRPVKEEVRQMQKEHTDDDPVTQQEHTDVPVTQQEHTDDVLVTQQEHTDGVPVTQQEHADDVQTTQQEHADDVLVTQQEHDVPVTQQEHTDNVPVTQQEHTDGVLVTQQEHTDGVPVTQQEHTDGVQVTQQEHTDDVPVTQQEHDVPVTQQEHDVLVTQQEHTDGVPVTQQEHDVPVTQQEHGVLVTQQEHTDDVPVTQQEHTDGIPVTQQEHTDGVPVTQQEHTDGVPVTQQEHTDGVPVTQQEHDVPVTQQEHDVPVTQQEHTDVPVTQQEHTDDVPVTQQEHTDGVPVTQQEHTDDVLVTQQEHTDDVQLTQQEHADDVPVTQQEHADDVPVTQQEHTDDVPVTQQEHADDVQTTQQEHTDDVPVTQQEHTDDVPVTQQEHTDDVQLTQQEHTDVPVTQQEHTDDVQLTQQEHTDVPVTQQEHTDDVPVTQINEIQITQEENTGKEIQESQKEHIDEVQITQEECTDKHTEDILAKTDVKGVYSTAPDHGESNSKETEWPCLDTEMTREEEACKTDCQIHGIDNRDIVMGSTYNQIELGGCESKMENAQREFNLGQSQKPDTEIENTILVQNVVSMETFEFQDESGVSEVDKTGCKAGYSLNCYSDSLGFVDFASLDSELPFITQSSDLMELQLLLQSISSASGHTLSLSSAQASTPDRAAVSDPGTCLPHIELCQETTTDLCDHSLDTLTWGGDGLSEVCLSSWTNALSDVHGGPLASSDLLDMSLGEEWFDFSSFITSSDVGCSLSLPASLSSCLMQEPPLCTVDAAEDTKEVMSGTLQRGTECADFSGTTGEGVFDKDGLFMIDGSATEHCTGLTSEPLGCATSDPCESICTGGEIVDGCAQIAPQCDNTSAFTDTVEAETSSRVSLCTDQTQLTSSTSTYEDILFCSQSSGISHSAQTVAHCGSLSQSDVVPTPSVSILEQKGTFADTKWKLQKQEAEERGASVSRVDQLDDAPDVVELSALPVCSEAVEGSPGKSVGVGKEKTMPFSVESHSAPRKPLVPYHLLDRQRRSLPGTECHKTSYFMDYLMFSGGGAYYNQLAQVFREQYIPTFRLKGGVQQFLKFFRERSEYFVLYEVPGGHFIRLRTLSYAPESTLSVEARKCGFIAAACRTLAYEEKGLQVGKLKRRSDLMRRVKLLHVDMLQLLGSCPDFFTVSSSTDSGHCVGLTSKAASVQKEFLPYYKRGSRSTPRDSSKTRRLMPTVEVTSLCVRRREAALQPLAASSANCEKRSSESPVSCDEIGKGIVEESCNKSSGVPMDAKRPKARSMLKWAICNDMLQKDRDGKRSVETSVPNFTAECDHVACKDGEKKPKERSTKKVKFQIFSDN